MDITFLKNISFLLLLILSLTLPTTHANTGEIITVDNLDSLATAQGFWRNSSGDSPYQNNSIYSLNNTFLWEADLAIDGEYIVEAYWTTWPNRSQQANYEITHANGSDNVSVNQRTSGAKWVELGRYQFNAGRYGVTLSNNDPNNSTLNADAIRFVQVIDPITTGAIEVDNLDSNVIREGFWATSAGLDPYDGNSEYSIGSTFSWLPMVMEAGRYQVQAYWTGYNNRSGEAQYTINHAEGASTATVDQKLDNNRWVSLGTYNFTSGDTVISLTNGNNSSTISADAIRLIPAPEKASSISENIDGERVSAYSSICCGLNPYSNEPYIGEFGAYALYLNYNRSVNKLLWYGFGNCERCGIDKIYEPLTRINNNGRAITVAHRISVNNNARGFLTRYLAGIFRINTVNSDSVSISTSFSSDNEFFEVTQSLEVFYSRDIDPYAFQESGPLLINDIFIDDNDHIYVEHKKTVDPDTEEYASFLGPDYVYPETYIQNYWLNTSLPRDDDDYLIKAQSIKVMSQNQ